MNLIIFMWTISPAFSFVQNHRCQYSHAVHQEIFFDLVAAEETRAGVVVGGAAAWRACRLVVGRGAAPSGPPQRPPPATHHLRGDSLLLLCLHALLQRTRA